MFTYYLAMLTILYHSWSQQGPSFTVLPLGTHGGSLQHDLSAFLLSCPENEFLFVTLDCGTTLDTFDVAASTGVLDQLLDQEKFKSSDRTKPVFFLEEQLVGYFVTHAHMDHLAGLVISSPDDKFGANKPIISRIEVIDYLQRDVFNNVVWPNMPSFGYYRYEGLNVTHPSTVILPDCPGLEIVRGFPLSHPPVSTAFLLRSTRTDEYVLFFGDTGPDAVEGNNNIANVWNAVAPLINEKKLISIFIESSYMDPRKNSSLFGHLSPYWINHELDSLAKAVAAQGGDQTLTDLTVIIIHIKMQNRQGEETPRTVIKKQLLEHQANSGRQVRFVFPETGQLLKIFGFDTGVKFVPIPPASVASKLSYPIKILIGLCLGWSIQFTVTEY